MNDQHEDEHRVSMGVTVSLRDARTEETSTYRIVAPEKADVAAGKLSVNSPVARAILGAEAGDSVQVAVPDGVRTYTVEEVRTESD